MSMTMTYKVLLALATEVDTIYMETILGQAESLRLSVRTIKDTRQVLDELKEDPVHLLITSPIVVSDSLIPLVKKEIGQLDLKVIAFCSTLAEEKSCHNFDGKILSTDNNADVCDGIENVLAIETVEEDVLTPREKDVVIAVVKGKTNKEIAEEFYLSPHTIITHRRNIAQKLNIHSPSGLTIYAIMNKLVSLDEIKDI